MAYVQDLEMSWDVRNRGSYQKDLTTSKSRSVQRREEVQRGSMQKAERQTAAPSSSAENTKPAAEKVTEVPFVESAAEPKRLRRSPESSTISSSTARGLPTD